MAGNAVHYLSAYINLLADHTVDGELVVDAADRGTTTCGLSIGGMLFCDLTVADQQVTCTDCLESEKYPLHVLAHTEL